MWFLNGFRLVFIFYKGILTIYKDKRGRESLGISCNGHCPQKREKRLQWKSNESSLLIIGSFFFPSVVNQLYIPSCPITSNNGYLLKEKFNIVAITKPSKMVLKGNPTVQTYILTYTLVRKTVGKMLLYNIVRWLGRM